MRHKLDIHPVPEEVLYINELSLAENVPYETRDQNHVQQHCTIQRGNNQGPDKRIGPRQRGGDPQRAAGGRSPEADPGGPIRAQ